MVRARKNKVLARRNMVPADVHNDFANSAVGMGTDEKVRRGGAPLQVIGRFVGAAVRKTVGRGN
jgi:hypothetical protein